ncbi:PREDICTED: synaptobrevin homolog 2-like isoform X1 [Polistes dominula]|uniref:Synaptobrevin homolog 2-like isoform X1 n=1 Tax=Polistes dominula TaxID=743375 RepID=A0ABM1HY43_POLDO|nr:PREDICTED: synaptobrevin homolog 2-like isoform X1 [Polistes dominula]XP_015172880.1 PREDICTED: synaptobrevin homolog 2-like isoform X1 [Polistes dominula]
MATIGKSELSRKDIESADKDEKETLLEHDSEPDEDMIFNRPSTSNGNGRVDGKMDSVKIQIEDVTNVMRDNVKKVMERGEKLEDLQDASDRLSMTSNQFREAANKAQRKMWLQNLKSRIFIVTIILTIIFFIFVVDILALFLVLR